jgi:hypothetical protein
MGVWKTRTPSTESREVWVNALLADTGACRFLLVRLAATMQSLLSLALLFLAALGFKRHFQMTA